MKKLLKILLSDSDELSSRRLISLSTLPYYHAAIIVGLVATFTFADYRYFISSLIAAGLPSYMAYFALTWQHVTDIVKGIKEKRRSPFGGYSNYNQYNDHDNEPSSTDTPIE